MAIDQHYLVTGTVTDADGRGLPGARILAFLAGPGSQEQFIGEDDSNPVGHYLIQVHDNPHSAGVHRSGAVRSRRAAAAKVFIKVLVDENEVGRSRQVPREIPRTVIDLQVAHHPPPPERKVFGTVRDAFGELMNDVVVHAYDRDLRHEQALGHSAVRAGAYEVGYSSSQFRRAEKDSADLVLVVLDRDGGQLYRTGVHYNAPAEYELNLNLGDTAYSGPSEWEVQTGVLNPLLDGLGPLDLREDEQHQDITFLSGESGLTPLAIGTWAAAWRLADRTARFGLPLPPEALFAFLRQGEPSLFRQSLLEDLKHPERIPLMEDALLRALAELLPERQRELLVKAVTDNLVPARLSADLDQVLATLQKIKSRYAAEASVGGGKGTVGQLLDVATVSDQHRATILKTMADHTGSLTALWRKLDADPTLPDLVVQRVRLAVELGTLTRNHVPLVASLAGQVGEDGLSKRHLAQFSKADWFRQFDRPGPDGRPVGVPDNIDGDTAEQKRETFAAILDQQFERAYPSAALAAKIMRAPRTAPQLSERVARFLDQHPDFHLDRMRIDHYLAEHPSGERVRESVDGKLLAELAAVQRVFKLKPTFAAADTLLSQGIESAQQIYFLGETRFGDALRESPVNRIESRTLYRKAESVYAAALATFADHNRTLTGIAPMALPQLLLDAETEAKINSLPNLRTLFGSLDFCDCADCLSVYSPAAHFVDVLRFLGDRATQGVGMHARKSVRDVLLERRPDLGDLELSCENTNTPVPYIDLVNEILEDEVEPPMAVEVPATVEPLLLEGPAAPEVVAALRGQDLEIADDAFVYDQDIRGEWVVRDRSHSYHLWDADGTLFCRRARQTFGTAAEVRANPEYLNVEAYFKLAGEVFPFTLPFDLFYEQCRGYLGQLGVSQHRLFELYGQSAADGATVPTPVQVGCALLGINDTLRQVLTGTLPFRQPWDFWGLAESGNVIPNPDVPGQMVTGTWIEVLGKVPVLLHRTRLTYRDLIQLLETRYVDPARTVSITVPKADCDVSTHTVIGLTTDVLDRIQRFVRLWRRIGVPMWELDSLLAGRALDDAALRELAGLRRLQERTELDWQTLTGVFRGFDDYPYIDRSVGDGVAVPTLYQRLFRNRQVDGDVAFPPTAGELSGSIGDRVTGLLAGLRVGEADFDLILTDQGLNRESPLTAAVLARLHRIAALARGLRLAVPTFLRLARLSGADPFASTGAALAFADLADQVSASEFTAAELDYLLTHHFTVNSGVALEDRNVLAFLRQLRQGLMEITDRLRKRADESHAAYVGAKLGLLLTLAADADLLTALAIVDGTWTGPADKRNALIDRYFRDLFEDLDAAHTALAELPAGETPAQRQVRVDARFALVSPRLEAFLLRTQKELHIDQQVAALLKIDELSAATALGTLRLSGSTVTLRTLINDPLLLDPALTPDETNFPLVYAALRLLHKAGMLIAKLGMRPADVTWWLTSGNADALGWIRADALGVSPGVTVPLARWTAMRFFFDWRSRLPASDLSALDFATTLIDPAVGSTATIAALAKLTAWPVTDITKLAETYGWLTATADQLKRMLRDMGNLARLDAAMAALPRLGVAAARAVAWADATPDPAVADEIKQVLKARYDLPQWLEANQPVQDELRQRRRDVMVDWLVAHPDPARGQHWTNPDGLFAHFLLDVEMSSCALTSRLKQATASAQLFVQRVLLNLEADITASTITDAKWKQWKWMRRYRLWEANRKVFLYPENWIEPELRDEKSPFFLDLENELRQNDVTAETVEQAYRGYLQKLDKVANLEIRSMFEQRLGEESVLHVIGRTRSSTGAEYFYRTRVNRARWTAWQPIKEEIKADHLMMGMHNNRLVMLWPQLLEKANEPSQIRTPSQNSSYTVQSANRHWDVQLFWSELKNGTWTPKVLSSTLLRVSQFQVGGSRPENLIFRTRMTPQIRTFLFLRAANESAPFAENQYEKLGPQITPGPIGYAEHIVSPPDSGFHGNLIRHTGRTQYFYYSSTLEDTSQQSGKATHLIPPHHNAPTIRLLRSIVPGQTWTVIDSQAFGFPETGSFFTWDPARTYFVDYQYRTQWAYNSRGWYTWATSAFRFYPHYHPFTDLFIKELNLWGLRGLLNRRIQTDPGSVPGSPAPFDFGAYRPAFAVVAPWPKEEVDFSYEGSYAPYNWELFFHAPMMIAQRLADNQRFEEAFEWFHYVFDPTATDTATPSTETRQQRYWVTKPFYETTKTDYYKQKIENILVAIAKGDPTLRNQVAEWRNNPFNPHLIARMRTVAYQKNVLIKYISTLIAWGDQLFGQDTIESINEATQLYVLAAELLGPRPRSVPRRVANPVRTFYQLQAKGIDDFGNVLRQVENLLPDMPGPTAPIPDGPELPRLDLLYFGVPTNEKLLGLWDTVEDRLFKIRHCMNLAGQVRQLPLFEPPIDPALLVKATAAGLDIGAALSDISAPMPPYRFSAMLQRAREVCAAVTDLGAALLAALEKRDAETFAVLRHQHEGVLLDLLHDVRVSQVADAEAALEATRRRRDVVEVSRAYHQKLLDEGLNTGEQVALALSGLSLGLEAGVAVGYILSGGLKLVPAFLVGAAGFGGTPTVSGTMGGEQVGGAAEMAAQTLRALSTAAEKGAALAGVLAGHARRSQEWGHQRDQAVAEIHQIDKEILAAEIRHRVAEQELTHHDRQRATIAAEEAFLRGKFTNAELYDWMVGQLSTVYFQSYQLAFDLARRAERCFRHELGLSDSGYVRPSYWDSLRKGLLAGERLAHDLHRLDAAYLELNKRQYELTKHVSLAELDPVALLQLKRNGECFVTIPEAVFDLDHPGHYFRRIKTVSLSIPCVVGPYGTVAATLTLTGNSLRKDATLRNGAYPRDPAGDPRFRDGVTPVQSIATSSAVNDHGLFELRFEDERYLPFEGAGAISTWHLQINADVPQFDLNSISNCLFHIQYTAREGGGQLREEALKNIDRTLSEVALAAGRKGLYRVFDLKREFPDEFYRFLHPANPADDQTFTLGDLTERLPFLTRAFATKKARGVEIAALMKDGGTYEVALSAAAGLMTLAANPAYTGLHRAAQDLTGAEPALTGWTMKIRRSGAADFKSLPADAIRELFLIVNYTVD
ncbi:MAG TPA: neuraminidase-like domain-containing protein [Nonomuraea sp.]|nr:neuraminidase-like domain-containing protein [Nonomuraea sp.]